MPTFPMPALSLPHCHLCGLLTLYAVADDGLCDHCGQEVAWEDGKLSCRCTTWNISMS